MIQLYLWDAPGLVFWWERDAGEPGAEPPADSPERPCSRRLRAAFAVASACTVGLAYEERLLRVAAATTQPRHCSRGQVCLFRGQADPETPLKLLARHTITWQRRAPSDASC